MEYVLSIEVIGTACTAVSKPATGSPPDPGGGAVGIMQLRMTDFERRELLEPGIEVSVRHDRIGIDVVRPVRAIQKNAKRPHPVDLVRGVSHG